MNIKNIQHGSIDLLLNKVEAKPAARQSERVIEAVTAPRQGDRISLSEEAKVRTVALNAASQAPDVRKDKLNAIRERVAAGEYVVDSRTIAQRLLEEDTQLSKTLQE